MECTGERYLPDYDMDWTLEHVHRYYLAAELAAGKTALDIACGEGYGSRLLADSARSVIGVDISLETVAHARRKYAAPHLSFLVGSAAAIPLADNAVDLACSFETIEHLAEQEAMLREIRRVLRPEGLLIISSPDKREYSDRTGYRNAYHVRELYRDEFLALLGAEFPHVRLVGQRVLFGSVIGAEAPGPFLSWRKNEPASRAAGLSNAEYLIALAGASPLPALPSGILKAPIEQSDALRAMREERDACRKKLAGMRALRMDNALLREQVQVLQSEVRGLFASRSWRVTAPLRALMGRARAARRLLRAAHRKLFTPVWPPDVRALETTVVLKENAPEPTLPIGVFLHLYYTELAAEMIACLRRLPDTAQVFVSTDSEDKRAQLLTLFRREGFGGRTLIRVFPNKGWDIAPFLVGFADRIPQFPLILRLHSKRSSFIADNVGDKWRQMMFATLAGSRQRVNAVVQAFADNPALGMAAPPVLRRYLDDIVIGTNFIPMRDMLRPFHIDITPNTPIDFPAGSMFWCRSAALAPWLQLGLRFDDFTPTPRSGRDGTRAHALERLFFFGCGITGHAWTRLPALDPCLFPYQ
jgi:hypothetical protein